VSEREVRDKRRQRARTLKTFGLLMALLCGLCTTTCAGPAAVGRLRGEADHIADLILLIATIVGVLPVAIGLGMFLVGLRIERKLKGSPPA